jgi:Phytanoyl-CoA dioxygenase (PhyH)
MNATPVDLGEIAGLRLLWARATGREPAGAAADVALRPLLDTLGLGLEQTLRHLALERPGFPAFAAWILATAGSPDPDRIARYDAWCAGTAPPAWEAARQAAVMSHDPAFTASERAIWERDGVVILRKAVESDEAAAVADHLWDVLAASPDDPGSWYEPRANGIMVQHFQHPSMDVPRRSMRIARAFAELYGHADLIASTDRLSFNPPERPDYRFPGPHLHWDVSLTPPIPFQTQGILYLTDTDADQGALRVVPGFHRWLDEGWLERLEGDPRAFDLADHAVTIPAGAGDLIIWRQEIPHGASANRSTQPRLAQYVNHYPMRPADTRPWL